MTSETSLLLFLGMGAVTYFTRRAFLRLPGTFFSARLKSGLSFIPVGIFAALIFPSVFIRQNEWAFQPVYLAGSVICLVLMKMSRNVMVSFCGSLLFVVSVYLLT